LCIAGGLVVAGLALRKAADWQNQIRALAGTEPAEAIHPVILCTPALVTFGLVLLIAWAFRWVFGRISDYLERCVTPRISRAIGFVLALFLFWSLVDGILLQRAVSVMEAAFAAADALTPPGTAAPTDPGKSGGPGSLVRREQLGNCGRDFVAKAPTASEISAFTATPAKDPVRVYVGRLADPSPQVRADIALNELIRQGGFDRKVLLLGVPVGSGWMDPGANDTLEFMDGGDMATVAVQYSYLTSVLSQYVDPQAGIDQASTLFDTVYAYWTKLPKDRRPRLYVTGLSQAAFNIQQAVPFFNLLGDPIDWALWAGSPFLSQIWALVRDRRVPGSPSWLPQFGNGSLVRVMNQKGVQAQNPAPRGAIHLMFLNYPSDAVVVFDWADLWHRPAWMREPPAPDVSPGLRWFPVLTGFQFAIDMAVSLQVPRFGYLYEAEDHILAWAELTEPPGWTP